MTSRAIGKVVTLHRVKPDRANIGFGINLKDAVRSRGTPYLNYKRETRKRKRVMSDGVSKLSATCAVIGARGVHGRLC